MITRLNQKFIFFLIAGEAICIVSTLLLSDNAIIDVFCSKENLIFLLDELEFHPYCFDLNESSGITQKKVPLLYYTYFFFLLEKSTTSRLLV